MSAIVLVIDPRGLVGTQVDNSLTRHDQLQDCSQRVLSGCQLKLGDSVVNQIKSNQIYS